MSEPSNLAALGFALQDGVVGCTVAEWAAGVRGPGVYSASGVAGAGLALLVERLRQRHPQVVVVAADNAALAAIADDLQHVLERAAQPRPCVIPGPEEDPYARLSADRKLLQQRVAGLSALAEHTAPVVAVSAATLLRRVPPRSVLQHGAVRIAIDTEIDTSAMAERLVAAGYLRVPVVEDPATFALRGGVFDVWGAGAREPVRFELFGDLVLSGKRFDAESQRTLDEVQSEFLPPAREVIATPESVERASRELRALADAVNFPSSKARRLIEEVTSARSHFDLSAYLPAFYPLETLWDFIHPDAVVVFHEAASCIREFRRQRQACELSHSHQGEQPHFELSALCVEPSELEASLQGRRLATVGASLVRGPEQSSWLERLEAPPAEAPSMGQRDLSELRRDVKTARAESGKAAALDPLIRRLGAWQAEGLRVEIVARSEAQAGRLASMLRHHDIQVSRDASGAASEVHLVVGKLAHGVIAPFERCVWLTEEEIFGQRAHGGRSRRANKDNLLDLRALSVGDAVVHVEHGVGRYLGLQTQPGPGGSLLELVVVEYLGGKLFLPVYRLNQIQKFSGGEHPKLDRLGGQTFAKTKARARKKAREMADELLRLYAERHAATKEPVPPADDDYLAFEAAFPYEETGDQAAAIVDVASDLESSRVMDRLVCGDVGFGKTEVALRAAFRVAASGKQVAVLCPTTVLAQQHYLTFQRRLEETPFNVRVLSRFQTKKQVSETLAGLRKGTVDMVVGTHRLLSKDLQFARLGLLVVDEEQRFGVVHKERIKQLRTSIDALTLTATPIPRTLQQAIGGLREMSLISTPPAARRAVRTVVAQFDDGIVREAVERELSRGGQVYYVYNRIEGLHERAARLAVLFPQAKIAVSHGQMREALLERTMLEFMEGHFDVLVTTAIVESGLDIPRANTMIIDRADLFGLAQLYQLRGRVGRSMERAFCYLLVPAPSELSEEARARIEALERHTELGSGFQIAALDMELRGAGDLLGAEQSGTVASVGVELFSRMLEEAAAELRGEEVIFDIEPELSFDLQALLPESYVDDVGVRLSLYKRLASASSQAEVVRLGTEMEDRFGPPPNEARCFVQMMTLKPALRRLRVTVCEGTSSGVALRFRDDTPLQAAKLVELVARSRDRYKLQPDGRLVRRIQETERRMNSLELAELLLTELEAQL